FERQYGLRATVATLLRRTAGRIALDEEQLGKRRVFLLTIGELAGQARDVERAFAPRHLARLARGFPRARGFDDFRDDGLRFVRVLEQERLEVLGDDLLGYRLDLRRDELVLRLRRKFRVRQ